LLVGGMERAMGLAEAMVARGYGATAGRAQRPRVLLPVALGLLLSLGGWLYLIWRGPYGWIPFAAGALLLGGVMWRQGRTVTHTHYRRQAWNRTDTLVTIASVSALVFSLWQRQALTGYTPYPLLRLPPFSPLSGLALLLLVLPVLVCSRRSAGRLL
jgi:hypothetical protein